METFNFFPHSKTVFAEMISATNYGSTAWHRALDNYKIQDLILIKGFFNAEESDDHTNLVSLI